MLSCCCGLTLRCAGRIVGLIGIIGSVIIIIILLLVFNRLNELADDNASEHHVSRETILAYYISFILVYGFSAFVNLIASILLTVGVSRDRELLLVPWLVNTGFNLLFSSTIFAILLFASFDLTGMLSSLVSLGISYYIWYAIYSLYYEIKQKKEHTPLIDREPGLQPYKELVN